MDSKLCREILAYVSDGVYSVDRNGCITFWNQGAAAITGYTSEEVLGCFCSNNLLMHTDSEGMLLCRRGSCPLRETMVDGRVREACVYLHHKNGHRVPVTIRTLPIWGPDGTIAGGLQIFRDESLRYTLMRQIQQLEKLSLFDSLTGLGNRRYAEMDLNDKLNDQVSAPGTSCGILFIDADRFKSVNDQYGHNTGDKVLQMIATTLKNALRDRGTIYRWGGEEFIAIIAPAAKEPLVAIANDLRSLVEQSSLDYNGNSIKVTVSIGAALAVPTDTSESIIKRADDMVYLSKKLGRNRVSI